MKLQQQVQNNLIERKNTIFNLYPANVENIVSS